MQPWTPAIDYPALPPVHIKTPTIFTCQMYHIYFRLAYIEDFWGFRRSLIPGVSHIDFCINQYICRKLWLSPSLERPPSRHAHIYYVSTISMAQINDKHQLQLPGIQYARSSCCCGYRCNLTLRVAAEIRPDGCDVKVAAVMFFAFAGPITRPHGASFHWRSEEVLPHTMDYTMNERYACVINILYTRTQAHDNYFLEQCELINFLIRGR